MKQRILTALILTPIAIAIILLLPTPAFATVVALAFLLALWEWTRLVGVDAPATRVATIVLGAGAFAALWWCREQPVWWWVIGAGLVWWLLALAWLRHFSFAASPTPRNHALKLASGFAVIVPAWVALIELHGSGPQGHAWTLFALLLIWVADSFAYFVGSRYGKTKLAPRISPGKTIEGAWGPIQERQLTVLADNLVHLLRELVELLGIPVR